MEVLHYTHKLEEKELKYLNNRYWEIKYQYDYNFTISQRLRFSKFSNKKVFKVINIILRGVTILIWLLWLKIGYKEETIVRISAILFIWIFWLFLKLGIFILDKPFFKAEIRENWIIIYNHCVAYDIKEISNIEMEKYYDGSVQAVKFAIADKDWIKHYYYWPYDDTIEKFCNDSILYYKKKNINIKIPIDNREPTVYEAKYSILDYWKLLSDKEKENVNNYIQRWLFTWFWLAVLLTVMGYSSSGSSESGGWWGFLMFCFIFIAISSYFVITIWNWLSTFKTEIKENKVIIRKMYWSHDYINCSLITDAKYKYFRKKGVGWIELTITSDWKKYDYTFFRNKEIEKFCNDVVEIAKNNKEYYSKINSSD